MKICKVDGCQGSAEHKHSGRSGYCNIHYKRIKVHGDPSVVKKPSSPAADWLRSNASYTGDDCLTWPFHIGADGYGRVHHFTSRHLTTASAMMCEIVHGPKPTKRHECAHSCGNGHLACTSPMHVRWATPQQNQQERADHGTSNRGTQQWSARLTEEDVRAIRSMRETHTGVEIAAIYGLHQSYVSQIQTRKRWAWLE